MRKKIIEKNLKLALLDDGPLVMPLFEFELEEHVDEYLSSKHQDSDKYFFAVTEHTNDVAMLLIDEFDQVYVNEPARARLKELWQDSYRPNMQLLIPQMANELDAGRLFTAGVKVSDELPKRPRLRRRYHRH
jgi:hypothetical protein